MNPAPLKRCCVKIRQSQDLVEWSWSRSLRTRTKLVNEKRPRSHQSGCCCNLNAFTNSAPLASFCSLPIKAVHHPGPTVCFWGWISSNLDSAATYMVILHQKRQRAYETHDVCLSYILRPGHYAGVCFQVFCCFFDVLGLFQVAIGLALGMVL